MTPDPWCTASEHGNRTAYRRGCRCSTARAACAAYERGLLKDHILGHRRLVDATGTVRRLRALCALGWPVRALAERANMNQAALGRLCFKPMVHARTAKTIARVYDELSMTPGPSAISRRRAAAAGWPPPLAWDDDSIDDPTAEPSGTTGSRKTIPLDDVELLASCGETWATVAARLNSSRNSIERSLLRHKRMDIANRLSANSERYNDYRNQWSA